jgi:SAM-dependent MidA family methyltransferase
MAKCSSLSKKISDAIHERGPLTVAAFMDLALYDPELGYYARAAQRTGRAGDFFTSVDVGAIFGRLLEIQIAEMWVALGRGAFDLVEAGAGNGRLSADILRAAKQRESFYDDVRLHLVEASAAARAAQRGVLDDVAGALTSSSDQLPEAFEGVLIANELLDALPVHQVMMREGGLREVYVTGLASTTTAPPSTSALDAYLDRVGVRLEPGWVAEINLRAVEWMREASRRLRRGFIVIIDYGHDARELYSVTHSAGTLTTFADHHSEGPESSNETPAWLRRPGEQDITAHVDFTSIRGAAEAEGLTTIGFLDQTYFLLGLVQSLASSENLENPENLKLRLALRTLMMPGGLGSTHKVLILGKGVGRPALSVCSFRMRVT